jgi:TusA-related sulfurtransferase
MTHQLDLRGIACPMNFVKTRLFLDKLSVGEFLMVILDAGEPVESVFASLSAEGHTVKTPEALADGTFSLTIQKMDKV